MGVDQHILDGTDFLLKDILPDCDALFLFKKFTQIILIHAQFFCNIGYNNFFVQV